MRSGCWWDVSVGALLDLLSQPLVVATVEVTEVGLRYRAS
jgi:hypothetical protein